MHTIILGNPKAKLYSKLGDVSDESATSMLDHETETHINVSDESNLYQATQECITCWHAAGFGKPSSIRGTWPELITALNQHFTGVQQ
jgi:hypothetical protein